ncbi:hypothetical protein [Roseimicrobium sp. ORNL1]|uniref:hypothetical protein n=1 Tax=Roseimicrobium sp. ORNL1 TaxID=2711231 RepID=UPI0013E140B3|nr:hypothetical protein [Roseimicrobium sp. ORNL1]QIF01948.1 hypothetical protein G5S37_10545 [Roseimicrobium sp. ORNL1]
MSRRIKLIILAIFLVLLAIPTVHFYLHWRPRNPLHFQLVNVEPPVAGDPRYARTARIVVHNTCGTPIHLEFSEVTNSDARGYGYGQIYPELRVGPHLEDTIVPSHGSVAMTSTWFLGVPGNTPPADDLKVKYTWNSDLKWRTRRLYQQLFDLAPNFFAGKLPAIVTDLDTTPLQGAVK